MPRTAQVALGAFARANNGLFILDGSAIGTDPSRKAHELDVYCVFEQSRVPDAIAAARSALSQLPGVKISYFTKREMSGALMTYITRRGMVLGERRTEKR